MFFIPNRLQVLTLCVKTNKKGGKNAEKKDNRQTNNR